MSATHKLAYRESVTFYACQDYLVSFVSPLSFFLTILIDFYSKMGETQEGNTEDGNLETDEQQNEVCYGPIILRIRDGNQHTRDSRYVTGQAGDC